MENKKVYQIAIDGPSGVGKSSIARDISKKLGFVYINTGAMYRCYSLALINNNVSIEDIDQVMKTLKSNRVELIGESVFLNGKDVTDQLNNPKIAALASKIGTIKEVREKCVADQQKIANGINCVMEGRDIGTAVFPNADVKIYLDADLEERANRPIKKERA